MALFGVFETGWIQHPPWHRQQDLIRRNALAYQKFPDPPRSLSREVQIIGLGARHRGITFDEKAILWMILQPLDIRIECSLVQSMVKAIMGKGDFVHVLVEGCSSGPKRITLGFAQ